LRALAERVASSRPFEHLAVLHGNADDVDDLLDLLAPVSPRDDILVGQVGPVIGTHAGPGVIGVTYQVVR
jgi:fatty acid-binding protein DegV